MVYFYISITLTITSYLSMIGWSEEPVFKLCTLPPSSCIPSIPAAAVWFLSPFFTCLLIIIPLMLIFLPSIFLYFNPPSTQINLINLFSLSSVPYHHFLISCYTLLMSLCFSFCLGCPDLVTQPLHIFLYPKIYFFVSIFSVHVFLFQKSGFWIWCPIDFSTYLCFTPNHNILEQNPFSILLSIGHIFKIVHSR